MINEIDGMRAWIAMEKARKRLKNDISLTDNEIAVLYALYMGYNNVHDIAQFRAFMSDRKHAARKIGLDLSMMVRLKLVIRGDRQDTRKGMHAHLYTLSKAGKQAIEELNTLFDHIYFGEFRKEANKIELTGQP